MGILRRLIIVFMVLIFLSCEEKQEKVILEFTEVDAYEITNKLKEDLIAYDSILYWHRDQVISPPLSHTDIYSDSDEIPITTQVDNTTFPRYTSQEWDMSKLEGVKVIEKEEFGYYFKENDSIDLEEQWNLNFKGNTVHHVSYPIYNPESKVAAIQYFVFEPFLYCGTDSKRVYLYKKVNGHWEKL